MKQSSNILEQLSVNMADPVLIVNDKQRRRRWSFALPSRYAIGTRRNTMSEPDDRIATVRPVEEHEATGKVAAIFADIKPTKNIDFVPRFWRVIATNPAQLELVWTTLKSLMHPESVGRSAARSGDPRDHRAGRLGDQRLPLLHQLAHRRPAQARHGRRDPRRGHGHRRPVQHDQFAGQRLSGRAGRPAARGPLRLLLRCIGMAHRLNILLNQRK